MSRLTRFHYHVLGQLLYWKALFIFFICTLAILFDDNNFINSPFALILMIIATIELFGSITCGYLRDKK